MGTGMRTLTAGEAGEAEEGLDFHGMVEAHQGRVFQIAYAILQNREDAEECAQETFLRAFRRLGSLRDPRRFRSWLGRIASRLALNRRRSRARRLVRETGWHAEGFGPDSPIPPEAGDRMAMRELRRSVDRLPEKYRAVLLLSAMEGMPSREVAGLLGIRPGTVRSRLHQARKRLLEELRK